MFCTSFGISNIFGWLKIISHFLTSRKDEIKIFPKYFREHVLSYVVSVLFKMPHGNQEYKEQREENPEPSSSQLGPGLTHGQDHCHH